MNLLTLSPFASSCHNLPGRASSRLQGLSKAKAEYDALQAEVAALLKEIESLKAEMKESEAKTLSLESDIKTAHEELAVTQNRTREAQQQVVQRKR